MRTKNNYLPDIDALAQDLVTKVGYSRGALTHRAVSRMAEQLGFDYVFTGPQLTELTAAIRKIRGRNPVPDPDGYRLMQPVNAAVTLVEGRTLAAEMAANAPVAVQLAKAAMEGEASALEGFAGAIAAGTSDGAEGVTAFREKRAPRFTGH